MRIKNGSFPGSRHPGIPKNGSFFDPKTIESAHQMGSKKWSKWVILGDSIHGRFIGVSRTKPVLSPRARARARARGILKMTHFWSTFGNIQWGPYMGFWKKGVQKWVIFIEDALLEMTHLYLNPSSFTVQPYCFTVQPYCFTVQPYCFMGPVL